MVSTEITAQQVPLPRRNGTQKVTARAGAVGWELLPQGRRNLFHKQHRDGGPWEELMSSLMLEEGQNFEVFAGQVRMGIKKQRLQSEFVLLCTSSTQAIGFPVMYPIRDCNFLINFLSSS